MMNFMEWLQEWGLVDPEVPTDSPDVTAVPGGSLDKTDLPPTPNHPKMTKKMKKMRRF